jgi:hypothetical protein
MLRNPPIFEYRCNLCQRLVEALHQAAMDMHPERWQREDIGYTWHGKPPMPNEDAVIYQFQAEQPAETREIEEAIGQTLPPLRHEHAVEMADNHAHLTAVETAREAAHKVKDEVYKQVYERTYREAYEQELARIEHLSAA